MEGGGGRKVRQQHSTDNKHTGTRTDADLTGSKQLLGCRDTARLQGRERGGQCQVEVKHPVMTHI